MSDVWVHHLIERLEDTLDELERQGFRLVLPGDAVEFIDSGGNEVAHLSRTNDDGYYVVIG